MGKSLTRRHLQVECQKVGLTYRQARTAVSTIFEFLGKRLASGEKIELPFGTMEWKKPKPKRHYRFGKIVKTYTKPKVHFRKKD